MKRRERINVYVSATRPAYDSAPTQSAELTDDERRTLTDMIGRYMAKCRDRAAKDKRKAEAAAAVARAFA